MKKTALLLLALLLAGCANTKITSYSDPAFADTRYQSFVVHVPNGDLETQNLISSEVCEAITAAGAECAPSLSVFPPTREYTNQQKADELRRRGVDAYLLVIIGGGSASSQYLGSQHFGTVNVYGNQAMVGGTSVAVRGYSRSQGYDLVLIDTASRDKAWVGGANTSAQGMANITNEVFASSLAAKLVTTLQEAGHL